MTIRAHIATGIVGVALLVGCASPGETTGPTPPGVNDVDGVTTEYRLAIQEWPEPLPSGEAYPETPTGIGADERYADGYAHSLVAIYWQCAWMDEFLAAFDRGDIATQESALVELEKWRDIPWVRANMIEDPNSGWEAVIMAPARLGDAAPMKTFAQSCS